MIDIARQINRTSRGREELQRLAAGCVDNDANTALIVPTGKPLSIFDAAVLPAAYTEFLFGDSVPFLQRQTPVTRRQIFVALPSRVELEYCLAGDLVAHVASARSRFDTPSFFCLRRCCSHSTVYGL